MSVHPLRRLYGGALLVSLALLSACSSSAGGSTSTSRAPISIIASTDVWGNIAQQIGGDQVKVTSIISNPDQDPHSYQADPQNLLALSKADIVIENGGGYDDFVDTMLKSAGSPSTTVLNAVKISGLLAPPGGTLNEHVWYDFPSVTKVVAQLVTTLAKADPARRATFVANAKTFTAALSALERDQTQLKATHGGEGVAITEPVPLYLLHACGLVNRTPEQFSEAVEDGTGVGAAVLQDTLKLFSSHSVSALVYNEQTSGPETTKVLDAARANHIPVVPVTETLPDGKDYLSWMAANLNAIKVALS